MEVILSILTMGSKSRKKMSYHKHSIGSLPQMKTSYGRPEGVFSVCVHLLEGYVSHWKTFRVYEPKQFQRH